MLEPDGSTSHQQLEPPAFPPPSGRPAGRGQLGSDPFLDPNPYVGTDPSVTPDEHLAGDPVLVDDERRGLPSALVLAIAAVIAVIGVVALATRGGDDAAPGDVIVDVVPTAPLDGAGPTTASPAGPPESTLTSTTPASATTPAITPALTAPVAPASTSSGTSAPPSPTATSATAPGAAPATTPPLTLPPTTLPGGNAPAATPPVVPGAPQDPEPPAEPGPAEPAAPEPSVASGGPTLPPPSCGVLIRQIVTGGPTQAHLFAVGLPTGLVGEEVRLQVDGTVVDAQVAASTTELLAWQPGSGPDHAEVEVVAAVDGGGGGSSVRSCPVRPGATRDLLTDEQREAADDGGGGGGGEGIDAAALERFQAALDRRVGTSGTPIQGFGDVVRAVAVPSGEHVIIVAYQRDRCLPGEPCDASHRRDSRGAEVTSLFCVDVRGNDFTIVTGAADAGTRIEAYLGWPSLDEVRVDHGAWCS